MSDIFTYKGKQYQRFGESNKQNNKNNIIMHNGKKYQTFGRTDPFDVAGYQNDLNALNKQLQSISFKSLSDEQKKSLTAEIEAMRERSRQFRNYIGSFEGQDNTETFSYLDKVDSAYKGALDEMSGNVDRNGDGEVDVRDLVRSKKAEQGKAFQNEYNFNNYFQEKSFLPLAEGPMYVGNNLSKDELAANFKTQKIKATKETLDSNVKSAKAYIESEIKKIKPTLDLGFKMPNNSENQNGALPSISPAGEKYSIYWKALRELDEYEKLKAEGKSTDELLDWFTGFENRFAREMSGYNTKTALEKFKRPEDSGLTKPIGQEFENAYSYATKNSELTQFVKKLNATKDFSKYKLENTKDFRAYSDWEELSVKNAPEVNGDFQYLTPEEKANYNYIYHKYGENEALDYFKDIKNTYISDRALQQRVDKFYDYTNKGGFYQKMRGSAASVGLNLVSMVESFGNMTMYVLTGGEYRITINEASAYKNALRQGVTDDVNLKIKGWDAFDFVYNAAMSFADSTTTAAIGGATGVSALPSTMIFFSAAADGANDVLQRGGTNEQAFWGATAAGTFELVFESFGAEKAALSRRTFKESMKNLWKTMGTEFTEEAATELSNILYDTFANENISNYKKMYEDYIADGYSPEEAEKKVLVDLMWQVVEAGAAGAFTGGAGPVFSSAVTSFRNNEKLDSLQENENAYKTVNKQYIPLDKKIENKNLQNGKLAIDKLIKEAEENPASEELVVKNAMYRTGIGNIDFIWGKEGVGSKFKKGYGLSHIIAKRNAETGNGQEIANKMVEVIAKGTKIDVQTVENAPGNDRIRIYYDNYTAVLSQSPEGNSWLLTGWENKKETITSANGEVRDSSEATAVTPTLTRHNGDVIVSDNSISPNGENVNVFSSGTEGVKNSLPVGQDGGIISSGNASLTFEEESALLDYKSSESFKINAMLRDGKTLTNEEMQFTRELDAALEKMPTYEGKVYRNLVFDDFGGEQAYNEFLNEHQIGDLVFYKAYTSASIETDGYPVEGEYVVKMEIQGMNPRNVDGFGNNFENEVIFQRNSNFIVNDIVTNQAGQPIIYLTEVSNSAEQRHNGQLYTESRTPNMQQMQEEDSQNGDLQNISSNNTKRNIMQAKGLRGVPTDSRGITKADADDASAFSNADSGAGQVLVEPSVERVEADMALDVFARIENKKRYTPEQQELIDVLNDLGWTLDFDNVFVKDKNGKVVTKGVKAIRANGEVNRKQKTMVIDYKTEKPKIFVIGHEFVHFLEVNPVVLQEYINNVMDTQVFKNWMNEKGYSNITDFVNAIIDERLEKNDPNFLEVKDSKEDLERLAYCEIAADFTGEKVLDSYEKLQELVNSMEAPKRRSFLKIMKDFFSGIAEKIAIRRGGEKGFKAELNKLNRAFQKAYAEAEKTYQKENTAEDGDVSYSVNLENSHIKEQLRNHIEEVNQMGIVADISFQKQNKKEIKNLAISEFKKYGFAIDRQNFGTIEIGEKQIDKALNYLNTDGEFAAILTVPKVLKRGKIISGHENHKGRAYSTITIAAPVKINDTVGNVAVVVKLTGKNRYSTHRILMPDGSEFIFNEIKKVELTSADMPHLSESQGTAIGSTSNTKISQNNSNVNNNISDSDVKYSKEILKQKQFEIIQKTNPMWDDYHTGIRSVKDILTWDEVLQLDDEHEGQFVWGDYSREDAEKALKNNSITVYSSYPIENGVFVSTSYIQAQEYAGGRGSKVYSKEISLDDVAWINGDEGQYANTNFSTDTTKNTADDSGVKYSIKNTKNMSWRKQINSLLNKKSAIKHSDTLVLENNTPNFLVQDGIENLPLAVPISVISKAQSGINESHKISDSNLVNLENGINNPIAVVIDNSRNAILFVTSLSERGKPIVVFFERNAIFDSDNVHKATSIHIREEISEYFNTLNNAEIYVENENKLIDVSGSSIKLERLKQNNKFTVGILSQESNVVNTKYSISTDTNSDLLNQYDSGEISREEFLERISEGKGKKTLNPKDIADLDPEVASTTPPLKRKKGTAPGDEMSNTYNSVLESSIFDDEFKEEVKLDEFVMKYESVTNKDTLRKAADKLDEGGQAYVLEWFNKPVEETSLIDIATGFILMDRYQRIGDYNSAVAATQKVREMGTISGQQVQIFSILGRLDPNTMALYAQKELTKAFETYKETRTQKWIDENAEQFNLTEEDMEFIRRRTLQAAVLPDGRDKAIRLAEIATLIQNKLPPQKGQGVRALQRISMLLNPKTNIRNIMGNATITPVFIASDFFGAVIDKAVSVKTKTRTTGTYKLSSVKGFGKGVFETMDDFRRHINTRNQEMDRFDVGSGKSFNENHKEQWKNECAKVLNAIDRFTSFCLEMGDRPFYEMWFINSLNNQMKLNNVSEATPEMIALASTEALQRTWQDSNKVTKAVSSFKNTLNLFNVNGYGLGDVMIKFTKTPANLTKAIFDFSPAGAVKAIGLDGRKLHNALQKGEYTPQLQKNFVDSLSKGITGTLIYLLAYFLAKSGRLSGAGDDDKDTANFEKYIEGIPPYSVKICGKWFSYDWAQPIGAIGASVADYMKAKNEKPDNEWYDNVVLGIKSGGQVLFDQSFMKSFQNVFTAENIVDGLIDTVLDEPSVFVPQMLSQVANATDDYRRVSWEYDKSFKNIWNSFAVKVPGLRQTLEKQHDVLGREIPNSQKNLFNAFFNPANTYTNTSTPITNELYALYKRTGDNTVIPRSAPYYINVDGKKIVFDAKKREKYQEVAGKLSYKYAKEFIESDFYEELDDTQRAEVIADLYGYANAQAKTTVSDYELASTYNNAVKYDEKGQLIAYYVYLAIDGKIKSSKGFNMEIALKNKLKN